MAGVKVVYVSHPIARKTEAEIVDLEVSAVDLKRIGYGL